MLSSDMDLTLLFILFTFSIDIVLAEHSSCLSAAQIAGIIFVTSFTTFFAVIGIGLMLWYLYRNRTLEKDFIATVENGMEKSGKTVCNGREIETENKAVEATIVPAIADKTTSCTSLTPKCQEDEDVAVEKNQQNQLKQWHFSRSQQTANHDFQSYDSINVLKDVVRCLLDKDTSALGFQIAQRSDGICISHVEPNGPAHRSGNIFVGDKIKELTVTFEKMPISDALTILSCASTYKIRLELERAIIGDAIQPSANETLKYCDEALPSKQTQQFSPLCKSHSASELAVYKTQKPTNVVNGGSFMSKQKHQLPRQTTVPQQEEMPSAVKDAAPLESSQPLPEISERANSVAITSKPVITEETITITEECPRSPRLVLKQPHANPQVLPSPQHNPSPVTSSKIAPKTKETTNSSSPNKPHQQAPSRIPSPLRKQPVLLLAPATDRKVDEIKHNGFSEFVERSRFTYSSATTTRDGKQKKCVEFCELIEPKRESIVIEFEEDQEDSQNQQEQTDARHEKITTNLSECNGVRGELMQDDGLEVNLGFANGGAAVDESHSAPKNSISERGTSHSVMPLEASNGSSEDTNAATHIAGAAAHKQIPSVVPNGTTVATATNKSNGNRMVPYNASVAESSSSHRKPTGRVLPDTVSQKSPKRSRRRKISSENANVDETVAVKRSSKPAGGTEDPKEERNVRSHIPQRSPKMSPKLQSHIPIVARTPSTKSRNKISRVEASEITDSLLTTTNADDALKITSNSEEMNGASLYIAKKEALRKTFLPSSKTSKSEEVGLSKERKARLDANQALLQRQQEELRALGVLP